MRPFYVYLLRCADGSYYCGHTDDIQARLLQHETTDGGYTATRKPVELVWQGEFETRDAALAFEQQIKGWSRAKKEALIVSDRERVNELARSRGGAADDISPGHEDSIEPSTGSGRTEQGSGRTEEGSRRTGFLLAERVLAPGGLAQRRAVAKAITLLESTRADHKAGADELLTALLPHSGHSFRLGISGVPGVGKSTFIEALGLYLIGKGHRVAVLTIDPSSSVSGGSILGDKTRMEKLSVNERAYIRPSPSSGTLGGVAERTREAMLVCEAAGYDIVIVETVGVGQSETAVAGMTDMFVLMQLPNAGDDLQAIKKGVMELADLVVINKADLDPDAATRAQAQVTSALRLFTQHGRGAHPGPHEGPEGIWFPRVIQLSALLGEGVDRFWVTAEEFRSLRTANGQLAQRRQNQALSWMWERIEAGLKQAFRQDPEVRRLLPLVIEEVASGRLAASTAARRLLAASRTGHADMDAGSSPA
jgi:LAO/AO transport system kinase